MVFVNTRYPLALVRCSHQFRTIFAEVDEYFYFLLTVGQMTQFRLAVGEANQRQAVTLVLVIVHLSKLADVYMEIVAATLAVPFGESFIRSIAVRGCVLLGR